MPHRPVSTAGGLTFAVILAAAVFAQRPPAPQVAPALTSIAPSGGQRGTAVDLVLNGSNLADPLAVWLGAQARVTTPPAAATGKNSTKIPVGVELPADLPVGLHRLRVATVSGLSNFRPFGVDGLPEVPDGETGHTPAAARTVPVPCVVSGRIDVETSNFYRFTVT